MGSCPVCLKSLMEECLGLEPKKIILTKEQKRHQTLGGSNVTKGKTSNQPAVFLLPEEEVVVSTKCGHLFHKVCLRDYVVTFRQITKQTFVECPICQERIIMSSTLVVDLRANNGCTEKTDKELKQAEVMNKELQGQVDDVYRKLPIVTKDLQDGVSCFQSLQVQNDRNVQEWNSKQAILNNIMDAKDAIAKSKEVSEILRRENLELASIYLDMLTDEADVTNSVLPDEIPRQLRPHLNIIRDNRELVKMFAQIVAPRRFSQDKSKKIPSEKVVVEQILERIRLLKPPTPEPELEIEIKSEGSIHYLEANSSDFGSENSGSPTYSDMSGTSPRELPVIQPPPERIERPRNICLHQAVHIVSALTLVDENRRNSSEKSDDDLTQPHQETKQRKFRSKMTDQRNTHSTVDKILAEKGTKSSGVRKQMKNFSAATILMFPNTDYSRLLKSKAVSTENVQEIFRSSRSIFKSKIPEDKIICDDSHQYQTRELSPDSNPRPNSEPSIVSIPQPSECKPKTPTLQNRMVSTGSQMSDPAIFSPILVRSALDLFIPEIRIATESLQNSTIENGETATQIQIPTFRSQGISRNSNIKDHSLFPTRNISSEPSTMYLQHKHIAEVSESETDYGLDDKVSTFRFSTEHYTNTMRMPTFKTRLKAVSNTGPLNLSELSKRPESGYNLESLPNFLSNHPRPGNSTLVRTLSSGFEVSHLSIVDYFNRPRTQFSLESLPSPNQLASCILKLGEDCKNEEEQTYQKHLHENNEHFSSTCQESECSIHPPSTLTHQESGCFTLSILNESDLEYDENNSSSSSESRPEHTEGECAINLRKVPHAEELDCNFNFHDSKIPPPLSMEELPTPISTPFNFTKFQVDTFHNHQLNIPVALTLGNATGDRFFESHNSTLVSPHSNFEMKPANIYLPVDIRALSPSEPIRCRKDWNHKPSSSKWCRKGEDESINLHPSFSEQLTAMMVPPPPSVSCVEKYNSLQISNPTPRFEYTLPKFLTDTSIFESLPEPPDNRDGPFHSHPEIDPELALIIQSRQAQHLRQLTQKIVLKARKTRRKIV